VYLYVAWVSINSRILLALRIFSPAVLNAQGYVCIFHVAKNDGRLVHRDPHIGHTQGCHFDSVCMFVYVRARVCV